MKKLFFIAAIASVAFASCVKNDPAPSVTEQHEITFAAPVVGTATKGETNPDVGQIEANKYPETELFAVYAMWAPDDLVKWGDASNVFYMDRVKCVKNATLAQWDPEHTYYWPKNGTLSFAAYSPYVAHSNAPYQGQGTFNYAGDGLTIENYRVYEDASKHYDLLYSKRSLNRTASTETDQIVADYDGVDLTFNHALSAIDFKVKTYETYNDVTITLKSIKVLDACAVGKFKENVTDGTGYVPDPKWTDQTDRFNAGYEAVNANQTVTASESVLTNHNDIILLPQELKATTLADSPKIQVVYDMQNAGGAVVEVTQVVNLADVNNDGTEDYLSDGTNDIKVWEIGKRYTYVISIALNKVYFAPYVSNWSDVTVTGPTI